MDIINVERSVMMNFYDKDIDDVLNKLNSDIEGLSKIEVDKRRKSDGFNEITDKVKITAFKRFISQFNNIMIILLLIVGVLSFVYSTVTGTDYTDAIVILFSVVVNAIMGYIQEKKAEDSLENIKSYVTSTVEVIREGKSYEIDSKELVKGDIIILESGDKIPADCRIIESINCSSDESVLTGESLSVSKNAKTLSDGVPLHERSNMLYSGTIMSNGKATAVVTEIGNNTEFGKIAKNLLKEKEAPTTLELKVAKISRLITYLAVVLVLFVIIYGILTHNSLLTIVMLCISMIVASVPECLPIAITATLSVGANQMAKKKAIVKKLSAIETLGATEIICSDKTGTLTTNEMTVVRILEGTKIKLNIREKIKQKSSLVNIIGLCNNASENPDKRNEYFGDSVEVAFIKYLKTIGIDKNILEGKYKRLGEIPFDSNRKMMSTVNSVNDRNFLLTKGSLSSVLSLCTKYEENGQIKKMTSLTKKSIIKYEKQMSKDALKVIALAYKPYQKKDFVLNEKDENNLIFVGLVGLIDPPRNDIKFAIKKCKSAGVEPIMITGDSLDTALSIAKEVGIAISDEEGILGENISNLSDDELKEVLKMKKVFARVTPDDKVRIVTLLQKTGKVIAMTGDGVNDAPAIKLANVGVGMGKTGSDVTKGAADIILIDDSFSTIVTAIEEGRRIYDNVISNILYNLSSNFTEIIIILVGMLTFQNIISPIHVLYIDLVADTIPSICLAFEKGSKNLMKRKPSLLNQNIFTPVFKKFLGISVIVEVSISLFVFYIFNSKYGLATAQTMALLSIVLNEFVFAYNCRSIQESVIKKGIFSNKHLNIGTLVLLGIQLLVFLTPIGSFFGLVKVSLLDFIVIFGINIVGFIILEILKPIISKEYKNN